MLRKVGFFEEDVFVVIGLKQQNFHFFGNFKLILQDINSILSMDIIELDADGGFSIPEEVVLPLYNFEVAFLSRPSSLSRSKVDLVELRVRIPDEDEVLEAGLNDRNNVFILRTQTKELEVPIGDVQVRKNKVESFKEEDVYVFRMPVS